MWKTATARQLADSEVLLDVDANARAAIAVDPALVLDGPTPRLLDEWQIEPAIWNHVRRAIDDRSDPGQFILTGSAVPPDDITRHTGAGRIARLRMRPMSLFETGHSSGDAGWPSR
jgi:predicted AAA+ superfamily ATPase